jgi:hypothetical protein
MLTSQESLRWAAMTDNAVVLLDGLLADRQCLRGGDPLPDERGYLCRGQRDAGNRALEEPLFNDIAASGGASAAVE